MTDQVIPVVITIPKIGSTVIMHVNLEVFDLLKEEFSASFETENNSD